MSNSTSPLGQEGLPSALRETILEIHQKILISQLTAVRKLRSHPGFPDADSGQGKPKRKGRS